MSYHPHPSYPPFKQNLDALPESFRAPIASQHVIIANLNPALPGRETVGLRSLFLALSGISPKATITPEYTARRTSIAKSFTDGFPNWLHNEHPVSFHDIVHGTDGERLLLSPADITAILKDLVEEQQTMGRNVTSLVTIPDPEVKPFPEVVQTLQPLSEETLCLVAVGRHHEPRKTEPGIDWQIIAA